MRDLHSDLEIIRRAERLPAIAAAAMINGELCEIAAIGNRRVRTKKIVEIGDKWHIGSCTKPMTSTLAGILIEQGQIDWTTTVVDVLQSWRNEMQSAWRNVTLEQLLSHHAGAPFDPPMPLWKQASERKGTSTEQRARFVRGLLLQPPDSVPGSKFTYSNSGYAIAGHMLERIAKQDWEELIKAKVFDPLGMSSAGFGTPEGSASGTQPCGHAEFSGKLMSVEALSEWDSPDAIGPGATVHCSIEHLVKFASSHADAGSALVGNGILHRLHRRFGASEYSPGWNVVARDWGGGYVLNHNGANYGWSATMWIAPFKKAAFVAATNVQIPVGQRACDLAVTKMIWRLL